MEFFNRKEEVLDIELTQYGKYLLSIGELAPAYYAFFDDDVIYDTKYQGDPPKSDHTGFSGPSENQKDSEDRIKSTPRVKVQHNFQTVEKTSSQIAVDSYYEDPFVKNKPKGTAVLDLGGGNQGNLDGSGINGTVGGNDYFGSGPNPSGQALPKDVFGNYLRYKFPYPKNLKDMMFGHILPLGTSKYNSIYAPAFQANFIKGSLQPKASINHDSGSFGIKKIPQIEMEVTFNTSIEQKKNNTTNNFDVEDVTTYKDNDPTVTVGLNGPAGNPMISKVYGDGTFVKVVEDYILLDLQEVNSIVAKDGFELEIFEIEHEGGQYENLKRIKFTNFSGQNYISPLVDVEFIGAGGKVANPNQVEYYFLAALDNEIEQLLITQGYNQNLGDSIFEPCEDDLEGGDY